MGRQASNILSFLIQSKKPFHFVQDASCNPTRFELDVAFSSLCEVLFHLSKIVLQYCCTVACLIIILTHQANNYDTNTMGSVGAVSFLSCLHFFITQWYHIALATPDIHCTFWRDTVSHHLPCHSMSPCNQGHGTHIQTLSVCVWSRYNQPTEPPECVV